jgi:hypothetical protein
MADLLERNNTRSGRGRELQTPPIVPPPDDGSQSNNSSVPKAGDRTNFGKLFAIMHHTEAMLAQTTTKLGQLQREDQC